MMPAAGPSSSASPKWTTSTGKLLLSWRRSTVIVMAAFASMSLPPATIRIPCWLRCRR
jgi:hypothetical protein